MRAIASGSGWALLMLLSAAGLAQPANSPRKHLLILGEEKDYRHEAVSHAMATIERPASR